MDVAHVRREVLEHLRAARQLRFFGTHGEFWDRAHAARVLAIEHGLGYLHALAETELALAETAPETRERRFRGALAVLASLPVDDRDEDARVLEARVHVYLADELQSNQGDRRAQRKLYEAAIGMFKRAAPPERAASGVGHAYTSLAKLSMMEGSYDDAEAHLRSSRAAVSPSPALAMMQDLFTGDLELIRLRLDEAASAYGACLRRAEERGITPQIAQASIGIGWVQLEQGEPDCARSSFLRALRAARTAGAAEFETSALSAHARLGFARACLPSIESDEALSEPRARRALDRVNRALHALPPVANDLSPFSCRATALICRARLVRAIGYEPDARTDFESAIRFSGEHGFLAGVAHLAHGASLRANGDDAHAGEAVALLERADEEFERLGLDAWRERVRAARSVPTVRAPAAVQAALREGSIRLLRHADGRGTLTWPRYPNIPLTRTEVLRFDTLFSRFARNETVALTDLFAATGPGQQRHARDVFTSAKLWEKGIFCEQRAATTGRVVKGRYTLSLDPARRRRGAARGERGSSR